MRRFVWIGIIAVALLTACSSVPDGGGQAVTANDSHWCLGTPLQSHRVIDGQTLLIEDNWGRSALLHMSSRCLLDDISTLQFTYNIGGSGICDRSDVTVTWGVGQGVPLTCIVSSVQLLSKDEAKVYNEPARKP